LNLCLRDPQSHLTLHLHALEVVLDAFLLKLTGQLVDPVVLIDLDARSLLLLLVVLAVLLILLPVVKGLLDMCKALLLVGRLLSLLRVHIGAHGEVGLSLHLSHLLGHRGLARVRIHQLLALS
jgi:hypothetical protein